MELDPAVVLVPFLGVASLLPVLSFVALQGSEMASIFQEPALCAEAPWQLRPCWIRIVRKRSFSEPFTCQDTSPDAISNLAEAGVFRPQPYGTWPCVRGFRESLSIYPELARDSISLTTLMRPMTQLTCSMSFWVGVGNWLEEEKSGWASCLGPSREDSACQDSAIQGPPSLVMTLAQESSEKPPANTQEVGWKRRAHTLERRILGSSGQQPDMNSGLIVVRG